MDTEIRDKNERTSERASKEEEGHFTRTPCRSNELGVATCCDTKKTRGSLFCKGFYSLAHNRPEIGSNQMNFLAGLFVLDRCSTLLLPELREAGDGLDDDGSNFNVVDTRKKMRHSTPAAK